MSSEQVPLNTVLELAPCAACGLGHIRPISIQPGYLDVNCSHCRWRGRAALPPIKKKRVYLDTSLASKMAKATLTPEVSSPWLQLYDALCEAAAAETLICCTSSVVETEANLSPQRQSIVEVSRSLGDPGLRHELDVRHAQVFRALDAFLAASPPAPGQAFVDDAFDNDPNHWSPIFSVGLRAVPFSAERAETQRDQKQKLHQKVLDVYRNHELSGDSFEELRALEASGFGRGIVTDGRRVIQARLDWGKGGPMPEVGDLALTTLDLVAHQIRTIRNKGLKQAIEVAVEFFEGEHLRQSIMAKTYGVLYAALALSARGPKARMPAPSDSADVTHIATFAPYFDIFTTDRFMASLCNQGNVKPHLPFTGTVCSVGSGDVESFVAEIQSLRAASPHAELSTRVFKAIERGGYIQERENALRIMLERIKPT